MRLKALALGSSNERAIVARFAAFDKEVTRLARAVVKDNAADAYMRIHRDCPVDDGPYADDFHMRDHIVIVFSADGLAYQIGWDEDDFLSAGQPFYPIFVIFGTRFMAARDVLFPNHEQSKRDFAPAMDGVLSAAAQSAARRRSA